MKGPSPTGPEQDPLPDGFVVRLNRHTRVVEGGDVLVGGSPTRVARLRPAARTVIRDRVLTVTDAGSRALAEHLLSAGMADPVVAALPEVDARIVTVVIPTRDRPQQVDRLLASLGSAMPVIVVDDASRDAAALASVVARHGAELVRLDDNVGTGGARNAGLSRVHTPFVAFIDSDVVADPSEIRVLLRHFADPRVAMVAPRVLGLVRERPNWITRYENARSSLDLGADASSVRPRSPVTWVSGTCLVARVDALGAGFDAAMRVGEDVDLVWRLVEQGWRVRFEPAATVLHEHRTTLRTWLGRKMYYGTGALPLAERHPRDVAPVVLPPWSIGVLVGLAAQRRWSLPLVLAVSAFVTVRIARRLGAVRRPYRLAVRLTGNGLLATLAQGSALLLRHWWPVVAVLCLFSRRARRAVAVAALADTVWEYARTRPRLDPVRFGIARRLDDAAYGWGVWVSSVRGRRFTALVPAIVSTSRTR